MVANEEQAALLLEWGVHAQSVFMGVLVVGTVVLACESIREGWGCGEIVLSFDIDVSIIAVLAGSREIRMEREDYTRIEIGEDA